MATVNVFTAEKMQEVADAIIVSAEVIGNTLHLHKEDNTSIEIDVSSLGSEGGVTSINDLTDVDLIDLVEGSIIVWDDTANEFVVGVLPGLVGVNVEAQRFVGGDYTFTQSTGWQKAHDNFEVALPAEVGGYVEAALNAMAGNEAQNLFMDLAILDGPDGTVTKYFGSDGVTANEGVEGWVAETGVYKRFGASVIAGPLEAEDIVDGVVYVTLAYRTNNSGGSKTLFANANNPMFWSVKTVSQGPQGPEGPPGPDGSTATTIPTTIQTDDYTLVLGDAGSVIEMNKATAVTLTIPPNADVAFPVNTVLEINQYGAGQVTVAPGAGVTLRAPNGAKTALQYSSIGIRKRATDEWVLSGDSSV